MREMQNAETSTAFDRLLALLVGPEGTGKSWLAATARQSVFFFDFDGRLKALSGKKNVYGITYRDGHLPGKQPTAFSDALTDLVKLEQKRSLTHLGFTLNPGQNDIIKTVVVDSLYTLGKSARDYAIYATKDISRTINVPNMAVKVPLLDAWLADMDAVESFLCRLFAIPDVDVIGIIHETQAKDPILSDGVKVRRTSKIDVFPERYRIVMKYFNEVWRLSRAMAGAPRIQFDPTPEFVAKSNLDLSVVQTAGPNITNMIAEHLKKHPPAPMAQKVLTA